MDDNGRRKKRRKGGRLRFKWKSEGSLDDLRRWLVHVGGRERRCMVRDLRRMWRTWEREEIGKDPVRFLGMNVKKFKEEEAREVWYVTQELLANYEHSERLWLSLWSCMPSGGPFREQDVKRKNIVCAIYTWRRENNIMPGQTKWSRRSTGTRDQCCGQCLARCPTDASGKKCSGVCHWKNGRPGLPPPGFQCKMRFTQRLSSSKTT